ETGVPAHVRFADGGVGGTGPRTGCARDVQVLTDLAINAGAGGVVVILDLPARLCQAHSERRRRRAVEPAMLRELHAESGARGLVVVVGLLQAAGGSQRVLGLAVPPRAALAVGVVHDDDGLPAPPERHQPLLCWLPRSGVLFGLGVEQRRAIVDNYDVGGVN